MQAGAARDLERMARERLAAAGLEPLSLKTFAGSRRLTLVADGLPKAQADREEELKGPRTSAPDQALEGFLRKSGLAKSDLVERNGVWFATLKRTGRPTAEIVTEMIPAIVADFPWPKSMTSGVSRMRWVRPLRRVLCVFDSEVVPFQIDGLPSGDTSVGHRFMGSGQAFKARDFAEYSRKLEERFVVLDPQVRKDRILVAARSVCAKRGLELVEDLGLLDEVAGLVEWPVPVLGDMDPVFLDLPPEVIRTSMRVHQRYFAVRDP
jgi:glycyl-tRNA synthetase beta chain